MTDNVPDAIREVSLVDFYSVEREAGSAVQTNIAGIWIAATTYLIAAIAALGSLDSGQIKLSSATLYLLPFPACALAGYHLVLFGTGVVRSKSIELVENAIAAADNSPLKGKWDKLGSKAETNWTNLNFNPRDLIRGGLAMLLVQVSSFLVPYLSAILLCVLCLNKVASVKPLSETRFSIVVALYSVYALFTIWLGVRTVMRLIQSP